MSRPPLPRLLTEAARRYQAREVLPHCAGCREPCCELRTLVLELTWSRLKGLWELAESRRDFDRRVARGDGPPEIRPQEGLYYAHGRPCPAHQDRRCSAYGTRLKPPGCTDFPVYEEEGALVADLRCEAVTLAALEAELTKVLDAAWRIERRENPDFPFLVSLRPRQRRAEPVPGQKAATGKRRRGELRRQGAPTAARRRR